MSGPDSKIEDVAAVKSDEGPETTNPASSAGQRAMGLIQRGTADPDAYAAILRAHPSMRQSLLALLHQHFGNTFVMAVVSAADNNTSDSQAAVATSNKREAQNTVLAESDGPARERNPGVAARRKENVESRSKERTENSDGGVVNGMIDSAGGRVPIGPSVEKVDRGTHREGLIGGIGKIQEAIFTNVNRAITKATKLIEPAEVPKGTDLGWVGQLLGFAASTSIYGVSAAIGAWAGAALFKSGAKGGGGGGGGRGVSETPTNTDSNPGERKSIGKQKFVENVVKQTIRAAFTFDGPHGVDDVQDLKEAYTEALGDAATRASARYAAQWSEFHDRLAQLSDEDLEAAHSAHKVPSSSSPR